MRRWFLSYNSQDLELMQGLEAALRAKDPEANLFFAPKSLRVGGYWLPALADEIAQATAFILLVGERGLGPWQIIEYYEALDKRVKATHFPILLILQEGQPAPGLPFLRQLHWIVTPHPASEQTVARLLEATDGVATQPGKLWRYTAPYRGLASMTESDTDFFFGRAGETIEVLRALETMPDRMPLLLGNSGVGKSSLAQAGVVASLKRQSWPEDGESTGAWPVQFKESRRWCFLKLNPGTAPLKTLVELFLKTWQFESTDPAWEEKQSGWVAALLSGKASLRGLMDATERRYEELGQPKPPAFFLYVDQGEELYAHSEEHQRQRFSELLSHGVADPRLRVLMSLRADFTGALQSDEPLYAIHHQINVPPLREKELYEVVSRPAELLSARFETDALASDIARRTAEESTKDAGALPLLSYLLDDMWTQMVKRGDGILRYPAKAIELGSVLADRANSFLASHPEATDKLRRILTLKLATVQENSEPTRRHALRSEFSDEEWRLVSELADHPHRLLVTATHEGSETYAEVAHEAIFRRWDKLREWIAAEREFLTWKSSLEHDRRRWEATPASSRKDALLMGLSLVQAQNWLLTRAGDLPNADREFVERSAQREAVERRQKEKLRRRIQIGTIAAAIVLAVVAGVAFQQKRQAQISQRTAIWKALAFEAPRQKDQTGDDDIAGLLARQSVIVHDGLSDQPTGLIDYTLYTIFPSAQFRHVLRGHSASVLSVAFSPDGLKLASGSWDRTVRVWDLRQPQNIPPPLATLQGGIWSLAFSKDGIWLAAGDDDGTIHVWDLRQPQAAPLILSGHQDHVQSVAFSPDAQKLASGSVDKTIRLWDLRQPQTAPVVIAANQGSVWSVAFSPDGNSIASGGDDGTIHVWQTDQLLLAPLVLKGHHDKVQTVVFSSNGKELASGSADKTICIWDLAATRQPKPIVLSGHQGTVWSIAFSSDGQKLASGSADTTIRIWDLRQTQSPPLVLAQGHRGDVRSVVFSPDGERLASGSEDTTIRVWDLHPAQTASVALLGNDLSVNSVAFDSIGQLMASGGDDSKIRIWNLQQPGAAPIALTGHRASVWSVAFSPNGRKLASGGADRSVRVWDLQQLGAAPLVLMGHKGSVWSVAFSPDGQKLASGSADATIRIWDLRQPQAAPLMLTNASANRTGVVNSATEDRPCFSQLQLAYHPDDFYSVAFSPDGQMLASGNADGAVRIWDLRAPQAAPKVLTGHQDYVCSVAFSPDSQNLASGSGDNSIRLWDLRQTQLAPLVLAGHSGNVLSVAFSPDGQRLISGSEDKSVRIWDMHQPESVAVVLARHTDLVLSVAFSPDGRKFASASADKTIRIWDESDKLADVECQLIWRNLSLEEWRLFVGDGISYERTCPNLPSGEGALANAPAGKRGT